MSSEMAPFLMDGNFVTAIIIGLAHLRRKKNKKTRKYWVRPWIARRPLYGDYEHLMKELELENQQDFISFLRIEPAMFYELLDRLHPRLTKQDTNFRKALTAGHKLAITLRFLASGNTYRSLAFSFRVPHNTISLIVKEVCKAIVEEYGDETVSFPNTEEGWKDLIEGFSKKWNFCNTIGAIDGKHIAIKAPSNSGTLFHNYKGFFSVILLAVVDSNYRFIWVNVGANGSTSDCHVFNNTLRRSIENGTVGIPAPQPLPGDDKLMPFFLIGDDAFPLSTWMMKPFKRRDLSEEERLFNYRLSRGRLVVENGFGILANRFRCLHTRLLPHPDTVNLIVLSCVCLHNIMRNRYPGLQNRALDRETENHEQGCFSH